MNEQPGQSEQPEDLFDWADKNKPAEDVPLKSEEPASSDIEHLFDRCKRCDDGGMPCERHQPKSINEVSEKGELSDYADAPVPTEEDEESSNRIADHEAEIRRIEEEENRPLTQDEIANLLRLPDDEDHRKAS